MSSIVVENKSGMEGAEPAVDAEVLADLQSLQLESDGDLLGELVALFLRASPNVLGIMERAIKANDPAALVSSAHTLKGSSANFGARRLQNLCGEAEALARRGQTAQVAPLLGRIASEIQRVSKALEAACKLPIP